MAKEKKEKKAKKGAAPSPGAAGGAASVSAQNQTKPADNQPLLAEHGTQRSDAQPASPPKPDSPGPSSSKRSPSPQQPRALSPPPPSGRGSWLRCDKTTYLRIVNWIIDTMEGDHGFDASRTGTSRRRLPAICCCLGLVALIVAAFFFGGAAVEWLQAAAAASVGFVTAAAAAVAGTAASLISSNVLGDFVAWAFVAPDDAEVCADGLVIPGPTVTPFSTLMQLQVLFWLFYGVSIGADLFMEAIETITSAEVLTHVSLPGGEKRPLTIRVWNATIANLTLMALGSSAPEILLSVIEICGNSFYSGELGPSTIVGSAAFNLMVISAVCVTALPEGDGRYIKQQTVFVITAAFSVFAYLWLMAILVYITPNVIDVWEGLLTLAFFPILVYLAYLADVGRINFMPTAAAGATAAAETAALVVHSAAGRSVEVLSSASATQSTQKHSAAYYRMNATRAATGGATSEMREELKLARAQSYKLGSAHVSGLGRAATAAGYLGSTSASKARVSQTVGAGATVELGSTHFSARDTDGHVLIAVFRSGSLADITSVDYTVSTLGGGEAGSAVDAEGRITFEPTQQSATVRVQLLLEDVERAKASHTAEHAALSLALSNPSAGASLGAKASCHVRVISGDAPGVLCLESSEIRIREDAKEAVVVVKREDGTHGAVSCTVSTKDGSAVAPADYDAIEELEVKFADGQTRARVAVTVHSDEHYEGDEDFSVVFSDATGGATFAEECDGGPECARAKVVIECDDAAAAGGCDACLVRCGINADLWRAVALDWYHQFEDAIAFDRACTVLTVLFFLLAVPWRLAFALAPPPRLFGGWACFLVALAMIGGLTALVGDYAGHLGCCMGISKSVTAITFVALGTSLPDTFASLSAARDEPHADNSLGNITGSNSVNVFLGLGLPWGIAAVYWAVTGATNEAAWRARYAGEAWYSSEMAVSFAVPAGSLGYSVTVFSGCAVATLAVLFGRRAVLGCELGGPKVPAILTALFFVGLWLVYIVLSILQEYAGR